MNIKSLEWMGGAAVSFGLSLYIIVIGFNLMPTRIQAEEVGNFAPWIMTWGMIIGAAIIGLVVGGFLVAFGTGRVK
jgi:hypothetical protein